jgi:hypothetical protein
VDASQQTARALGWQLQVIAASSASEIDTASAVAMRQRANALVIGVDPFFRTRFKQS